MFSEITHYDHLFSKNFFGECPDMLPLLSFPALDPLANPNAPS
jgi:hypothetical protein